MRIRANHPRATPWTRRTAAAQTLPASEPVACNAASTTGGWWRQMRARPRVAEVTRLRCTRAKISMARKSPTGIAPVPTPPQSKAATPTRAFRGPAHTSSIINATQRRAAVCLARCRSHKTALSQLVQSGLLGQCELSPTTAVFSVPYPGHSFTIHPREWSTLTLTLTDNDRGIQLLANIPKLCSGYATKSGNGAEGRHSMAQLFTTLAFSVLLSLMLSA